ncbi:type VI secretion system tube protein TssD [Paraburkholderia solisilvae]|uniref:Major exported protein n=1 Tax=Paraburkholderia solisilvae TaxID=624376 RepID=A0A6J5CVN6_9BURK|nr:type VI secretion system tube protein TssD [Paraburkholderia solisilvae]CAB3746019.1 Major exported protein [Paraburkholderia solisilvae]
MGTPLHLWLTDDGDTPIRGGSEVSGREGSIEVLSLTHGVDAPVDHHTGKLMGTHSHRSMTFEKEIDRSSPLLYQAIVRGNTLNSAVLRWYRTNDAGQEENYFTMSMKNVKLASIAPRLKNIKEQEHVHRNHFEIVELRYGEITWNYHDGNLLFADTWRTVQAG